MNLGAIIRSAAKGMLAGVTKTTKSIGDSFTNFGNNAMSFFGDVFRNAGNKYIGMGLTDAEKEANAFTTSEREAAQDWTAQREDTQYQRTMADMKAAGINPMMAAGGFGASSTAPSSGGSSVAPQGGSLSDLLQIAMIGPQISLMKAQAENMRASAREKDAKVPLWKQKTEETIKNIDKIIAQTETESTKQAFYIARAALANASEENIKYLQDSVKALNEAKTEEAKQNATFAMYRGMIEKQMVDKGYVEKQIGLIIAQSELANEQKKVAEEQHYAAQIANAISDGTWHSFIDPKNNERTKGMQTVVDLVYAELHRATSSISLSIGI